MKIVILGESLLTIPTLQALLQYQMISGLCTSASTEADAVKVRHMAKQAGVPVLQVTRRNVASKLVKWLNDLKPDLVLMLTFPFKLPSSVVGLPPKGFLNYHFGALPEYRGPTPIFWEILNSEPDGAVSIHQIDDELDHGPLVIQEKVPIDPTDTYGMHSVKLAFAAVTATQKLFGLIQSGQLESIVREQDHSKAGFYPRPKLHDVVIDWKNQDSKKVRALVKASNPWNNGAFASIKGINLRILEASLLGEKAGGATEGGEIHSASEEDGVVVACKDDGLLKIEIVNMEEGYLLGSKLLELGIKPGDRFDDLTQHKQPKA